LLLLLFPVLLLSYSLIGMMIDMRAEELMQVLL
jgi:hypothetical protein